MEALNLVDSARRAFDLFYWAGFRDGAVLASITLIVAYLLFYREGGRS